MRNLHSDRTETINGMNFDDSALIQVYFVCRVVWRNSMEGKSKILKNTMSSLCFGMLTDKNKTQL